MHLKWQAPYGVKTTLIFVALFLHGLVSSPAPADPGWAEALIGLCLLIAAAPQLLELVDGPSLLHQSSKVMWLWLLLVPLGIGLYAGRELRDLSRDLLAVGFLGLPILIGRVPPRAVQIFAAIAALTGSLLAARYWIITGAAGGTLQQLKNGDGLLYLCLDPTMLFAAVYLPITIMETRGMHLKSWAIRAACLIGAFLCWGTLGGMQMRGALGLALFAISIYALLKMREPMVPLIMGGIGLGICVLFWGDISRILLRLWQKQQQVGFNAREDDFAAIWKIISADPLLFLFGSGWGSVYSSPAVGGYWVNYSHSAIGYFLFKTGTFGALAMGIYLLSFLQGLKEKWRQNRTIFLALVPPMLLSFTIYTSYKFLTCGMLLLLLQNLNAHSDPEPG